MKMMLDSGAYSAWRLKKSIDIGEYCDFVHRNSEWITCYANMDIIIPDDPERAATQSLHNLKYMQSRGLNPIGIFHARENMDWIARILDTGCRYLGLGGRSLPSPNALDEWYELAWSHVPQGTAVHAFGEARPEALIRYPWTSADTTTWVFQALRYGDIILSDGRRVHGGHSSFGAESEPSIWHLTAADASHLEDELNLAGFDTEILHTHHQGMTAILMRGYLAARAYVNLENRVRAAPLPASAAPGLLFAPGARATARPEFTLYLNVSSTAYTLPCMGRAGVRGGLASYYYLPEDRKATEFRGTLTAQHLRDFVAGGEAALRQSSLFRNSMQQLDEVLSHASK